MLNYTNSTRKRLIATLSTRTTSASSNAARSGGRAGYGVPRSGPFSGWTATMSWASEARRLVLTTTCRRLNKPIVPSCAALSGSWLTSAASDSFLCLSAGLPSPCTAGLAVALNARPRTRVVCAGSSSRASAVATPSASVYPVEADLSNAATVLHHPSVAERLDLSRPTGLLMVATLETVRDDREAATAMLQLVDALATDSYVMVSNCTMDYASATQTAIYDRMSSLGKTAVSARSRAVIERWAAALELLEPGIVPVAEWQPGVELDDLPPTTGVASYGFVGRVP